MTYIKRFLFTILRRFKIRLLILLVLILVVFFFIKNEKKVPLTQKPVGYPDAKIKTQNYLQDYALIQQSKHKTKLDPKSKVVVPNSRDLTFLKSLGNEFLILEFTKVFGETKYCHHFDSQKDFSLVQKQIFIKECPYTNCVFTCDKNLLNDANALLFHQADLENLIKETPDIYEKLEEFLVEREKQIWILWNDEANPVGEVLDKFKFNWTLSYRLDSEVSDCAYGCKYKKPSENINIIKYNIKLDFDKRENSALWFVSNCGPQFRLKFASELKRYFPVNVYGTCSSYIEWSFFKSDCSRESGCEVNKLNKNKFYLSFESKNCSNYMTEKVWKMLHIGIIPVVIQPSKEYYEMNLPPNSFIHAQDFGFDAKKLADHLNYVANNFEVYFSYLKWKQDYDVSFTAYQNEKRRQCELCTKLNTEKSVIYYEKISEFFNDQCIIN